MSSEKVENCVNALIARKLKISFAESATAGRLASEFGLAKDSGEILLGGIVCYDVSVKCDLMKIPADLIEKFTPESAEVTRALAENLSSYFKSDIFVAITGLTAPGGSETAEKPVGTMFIHIITPYGYMSHREVFFGSPEEITLKTVDTTCGLILKNLKEHSQL